MTPPAVLMIDNHDSFTFNLVDAFAVLGAQVRVLRNTVAAVDAFAQARSARALVVMSPGPGGPEDAGCCLALTALCRGVLPVLGVCLGHQVIAHEAGAPIVRAYAPFHGKAVELRHDGAGPFAGVPSPTTVGRYHSLAVRDLPRRFHVHARHQDVVMAFSDPAALQTGVQFHPESILTPDGARMLANILADAAHVLHSPQPEAPHARLVA